jgi:tRNA threonylcarbamoyladenosine biosynthesis protein TsaB
MPTLNQLLDEHRSVLVLDAASSRIQVGWLAKGEPAAWQASDAEAGTALFAAIDALGRDVNAAAAFVYCEGPGSMLGIRTAAAAIRAWSVLHERPAYAYGSLALVATALGLTDQAVIADARRDLWHIQVAGQPLRRVPAAELPARLVMPEGFRCWSAEPAGVERVSYDVRSLLHTASDIDLLRQTDAPEAFMHEPPNYVTWTPQIHRAPAAP